MDRCKYLFKISIVTLIIILTIMSSYLILSQTNFKIIKEDHINNINFGTTFISSNCSNYLPIWYPSDIYDYSNTIDAFKQITKIKFKYNITFARNDFALSYFPSYGGEKINQNFEIIIPLLTTVIIWTLLLISSFYDGYYAAFFINILFTIIYFMFVYPILYNYDVTYGNYAPYGADIYLRCYNQSVTNNWSCGKSYHCVDTIDCMNNIVRILSNSDEISFFFVIVPQNYNIIFSFKNLLLIIPIILKLVYIAKIYQVWYIYGPLIKYTKDPNDAYL